MIICFLKMDVFSATDPEVTVTTPCFCFVVGICLAFYESSFNTNAVGPKNYDGSRDYGIFQINSRWWCTNGAGKSANGCRISCNGKYFLVVTGQSK